MRRSDHRQALFADVTRNLIDDAGRMRTVLVVMYVAMAAWLLLAAGGRIVLQLSGGFDLDPLPFISGGIGALGLIAMVSAREQHRQTPSSNR
jgi:hypothetical protein